MNIHRGIAGEVLGEYPGRAVSIIMGLRVYTDESLEVDLMPVVDFGALVSQYGRHSLRFLEAADALLNESKPRRGANV